MSVTSTAITANSAMGLAATLELAPVGLAQFEPCGRFLYANSRLCEILGCSREDLASRTLQEITHPDDLPHCLELTSQLTAGLIPNYVVEKRFVRPDRSVVWTRITVSAVRSAEGSVAFLIGAAEDITEQVAAAQALRVADERLHTALDASMIGTFRFDSQSRTMEWADGLERVFGPGERSSLEDYFSAMHPDDRAHVMASYTASISTGADFEEEFRVIWPDGSVHWLHDRGRTIRDATGTPRYIVGAITDISNHKRMEAIIAARDAHFKTVANSIPQLAWVAAPDGSRSWFNDRWLEFTGASIDRMIGYGWMQVYESREEAEAVLNAQRAAFAAGRDWEGMVRLRRADGQYRWFLSRAMPVRAGDDSVREWFGTNTDITDRLENEQALERALREAQRARHEAERATVGRQQVLGYVVHDLRNPLQAILAGAAVLALPGTPEQLAKRTAVIARCAKEMDRLIADLLDVSRIDAGTFTVRHQSLEVGTILTELVDESRDRARGKSLTLESEIEADLPVILGDRDRLKQAVGNLLGNAVKFTPHGGRIRLVARQAPAQVIVAVVDSGCGIAPAEHDSIFERFWQRDHALGGAGLGLAIVKGIVDAHDGTIAVNSTPGEGATFTIHLPC